MSADYRTHKAGDVRHVLGVAFRFSPYGAGFKRKLKLMPGTPRGVFEHDSGGLTVNLYESETKWMATAEWCEVDGSLAFGDGLTDARALQAAAAHMARLSGQLEAFLGAMGWKPDEGEDLARVGFTSAELRGRS